MFAFPLTLHGSGPWNAVTVESASEAPQAAASTTTTVFTNARMAAKLIVMVMGAGIEIATDAMAKSPDGSLMLTGSLCAYTYLCSDGGSMSTPWKLSIVRKRP